MGNKGTKSNDANFECVDGVYKQKKDHFKEFHRNFNSSLRSFPSISSQQSSYSVSRPWSRVSRRRWKESTLTLPYESSKTAWPVSQLESCFLPEFPITSKQNDKNFEVIAEVNKGSFGKVYRVRHLENGQLFALKVLSKSKIIRDNSVVQVKNEVEIQKACGHHSFIASCCWTWQSKAHLYIVSEFVEGGELFDLLKSYGILPLVLAQLYVAQIALAIDFLHNAGIIYRDLKPENILLDSYGNIKLIDFGLSKWLSYSKTTNTVCGTLHYMAPEIVALKPYGHAVDWWSLGVIACIMLTGKYPSPVFDSDLPEEYSKPGTLPTTVELDVSSKDLLLRLLEIDPTRRLKSLRTLETIRFFKGFSFEDVKQNKIRPTDILHQHNPNLMKTILSDSKCVHPQNEFHGFDESFINEEQYF